MMPWLRNPNGARVGCPFRFCHERSDPGLRMWITGESPGGDAGASGSLPEMRRNAHDSRPTCPRRAETEESAAVRRGGWLSTRADQRIFHPRAKPVRAGPGRPGRETIVERKASGPIADGFLPALEQPETNWFASVLYPLRGADGLGMIAATSAILWLFTILIPEYCLTLMGDADSMGAPTIGYLIALISILPVVILLPLAILYWLQYLGRTLVSSAMGETVPPRTPDRNFNGFFSGISPWLLWLAMGVSVGLLPLLFYIRTRNASADLQSLVAVGLLLLGVPYISLALMLAFLHDHPLGSDALEYRYRHVSPERVVHLALAVRRPCPGGDRGRVCTRALLTTPSLPDLPAPRTRELGGHAMDVDRSDARVGNLLLPPRENTAMASREPALGRGLAALIHFFSVARHSSSSSASVFPVSCLKASFVYFPSRIIAFSFRTICLSYFSVT